jgi:hypothetical protein
MSEQNVNVKVENNLTESVVDEVENKVVEVENKVDEVVNNAVEVVNNAVEVENGNNAEEIAGKVVSGVVNNLVKEDKTKVSFVVDVESKAIVESMAEALDNFTVDKLMEVLPRLIAHVQNYKNLTGPEKRSLVIRMLNHIIDITDCPGDDEIWDPIMKRLVPSIIDSLIKVENKQLRLRKKQKCFGKLLGCMSR